MKALGISFGVGLALAVTFAIFSGADEAVVVPDVAQLDDWSESSRADDPIGFIEYVQRNVADDRSNLERGRTEVELAKYTAEKELQNTRSFLDSAEDMMLTFREAFQNAERAGRYPTLVDGVAYGREELIEQTMEALTLSECFQEIVPEYEQLLVGLGAAEDGLETRSRETDAVMDELHDEMIRVRVTSSEANDERILQQAQAALNRNGVALAGVDADVPKFEEMLQKVHFASRRSATDEGRILNFLRKQKSD